MKVSKKMLLKKNLNTTHMRKTNIVTCYLMKIEELRDQIATIGNIVDGNELVQISLNRFSPPWHYFA